MINKYYNPIGAVMNPTTKSLGVQLYVAWLLLLNCTVSHHKPRFHIVKILHIFSSNRSKRLDQDTGCDTSKLDQDTGCAVWCWLCKLTGFQVRGKWPGQTRPRVKTRKPALEWETQGSWSFGAGVLTGKLIPQLGALPTRPLYRVQPGTRESVIR